MTLPSDSKGRKDTPMARGLLDYFPAALAAVAQLSRAGNEKHNPGEEMHHARGKSTDHADCILRHLVERGEIDPEDGILHDVKVAWRALAMLQEELERRGAPLARGARLPEGTAKGGLVRADKAGVKQLRFFSDGSKVVTDENGTSGEAPNDIDSRIAGDTKLAREIKDRYYHGREPGKEGNGRIVSGLDEE